MNLAIASKWTSTQNFTPEDPFKINIIWLKSCSSFDRTLLMRIFSFSTHSFGFIYEFWGKGNHNDVVIKNVARLRWKLFRMIIWKPSKIIAILLCLQCTILIEYSHYFHRSAAFCSTYGQISYQSRFCILNIHT